MANTQKLFTSRASGLNADEYVGEFGRVFYDEPTTPGTSPILRYSDGITVGGVPITGGSSGGISLTDLHVDYASASNGGNLTYNSSTGYFTFSPADFTGLATETWVTNLLNNYNDLGDLYIGTNPNAPTANQTIFGNINNADIVISPKGSGLFANYGMRVLDVTHPAESVGSIINGRGSIVANISNVYIEAIPDNGDVAELVPPIYGLTNGITGVPYTVYQLTEVPDPLLQNGDIIGGAAIPVGSTILYQGTDGSGNYFIITDRNFPVEQTARPYADPTNGQPGHISVATTVARAIVNAGLSINTIDNTDITLNPGPGGNIVAHSDILPFTNGIWNLGSPSRRFNEIWFGTGTIYLQDETLGNDQAIGCRDGNLYITGGAGLTVGEFTLRDNEIRITDPTRDIVVGSVAATGRVLFNRPIAVNNSSGQMTFKVDRAGLTTINTPSTILSTESALTITGNVTGYTRERNFPDTLLMLSGRDGATTRMNMDSFGPNTYNVIAGRQANGTALHPTATLNNDTILRFSVQGWGDTNYVSTIGRINIQAAQNFTDTAAGTRIRFQLTPVDSVTIQSVTADLTSTGLSFVGNSTGGITYRDSTRQITAPTVIPSQSGKVGYYLKTDGVAGGTDVNGNTTTGTLSWAPIPQAIVYKGVWDANNNTPVLNHTTAGGQPAETGWEFSISTTSTRDIGSGSITYEQGGFVIYNGADWEYIPPVSGVSSIQFDGSSSYTGAVHVQSSDIVNTLDTNSIPNNKLIHDSITVTAGTGMSGGGVVALGGSITLNNNGITSITAGTGISVTGTNSVTISSTGIISVTGTNHISASTLNGVVTVTSDASSVSTANTIALRDNTGGLDASNFTATQNVSLLTDHGAFNYGTLTYSDTGIMVNFSSSANNYNQIILQNTSSGSNASTNYIVSNDYGTASSYYGEFGMNSSGFTGPGSMDIENAVYLASASSDLVIATLEAGTIHFVTNSNSNPDGDAMWIDGSGIVYATNTIQGTISSLSNHTTTDLAEGTNKYYTDSRARQALHLTSNTPSGTTSTLTYDNNTGYFTFTSAAALISGTTIKTVNGNSLLGSGNVSVGTVTSISSSTLTTGGTSTVPTVDLVSGIVTAGSYGSASLVPVVTVDTYGRVTNITTVANPLGTVTNIATSGSVSGITLTGGPITSTGTITLGGSISGLTTSNLSSSANIANGQLANSTISGVSLGGNLSTLTISGPLTGTSYNGSTAVSIGISQASGSTSGYLSSTDWTTFNNKTSNTGTVTSITASTTPVNGLSLSGGAITTSGTIAITGTLSGITNSNLSGTAGITNANLANSSVTVTAGTGMSGGGSVSLGGTVTLTNAGVTSAVAGTGIGVSGSTGAVTITNTGVTSIVAGTNVTISGSTGAVTINSTAYSGYGNNTLYYALNATLTIGNTTANTMYNLFGVGATVLANTRYEVELEIAVNGPTASRSLFGFDGVATPTRISFWADNTTSSNNNPTVVYSTKTSGFATGVNICGANVQSTVYSHRIKGIVDIGATGGTFTALIGFIVNGTGVTVNPQSWMRLTPLGATGANTVIGTWA